MSILAAGQVVIVHFPFSDLSQSKLHPAVVLAKYAAHKTSASLGGVTDRHGASSHAPAFPTGQLGAFGGSVLFPRLDKPQLLFKI
jgi:hypothetical protein